jgi:hypothetical protein
MKTLQQQANAIARKHGHKKATKIVWTAEPTIVESVDFGYRKKTTGEYVPNAYRANFGWKNTYYQKAVCVVGLPEAATIS